MGPAAGQGGQGRTAVTGAQEGSRSPGHPREPAGETHRRVRSYCALRTAGNLTGDYPPYLPARPNVFPLARCSVRVLMPRDAGIRCGTDVSLLCLSYSAVCSCRRVHE
jgi:hypothetical protein